MKDNKLSIEIDRPVSDVFGFTTDPANTPRCIDAIVTEDANETPPKPGTIYRNRNRVGLWNEYEMTEFEPNKTFTLTQLGKNVMEQQA